jgi:hypothetical protein
MRQAGGCLCKQCVAEGRQRKEEGLCSTVSTGCALRWTMAATMGDAQDAQDMVSTQHSAPLQSNNDGPPPVEMCANSHVHRSMHM